MKAIIGVDGSSQSWQALKAAAQWLSPDRDRLVLYFSPPHIDLGRAGEELEELRQRAQHALVETVFSEALQQLPVGLSRTAETCLGVADPRHELLDIALQRRADFVLIGARGHNRLRKLLLGSVALSLARYATLPVLVARQKRDKATEADTKVLMPIDEIPTSGEAAEFLRNLAWPATSAARLMHVIEPEYGADIPHWLFEHAEQAQNEPLARAYLEQQERQKREKFAELSAYRRQLPVAFEGAPPIVLTGNPAQRILETAASDDIDLIILGSKPMNRFQRLMLGSTAERVLTHAPCSVLLLPHR